MARWVVCHSAFTAGKWQSWGTSQQLRTLSVYTIHGNCQEICTFRFKDNCKESFNFFLIKTIINKVSPAYTFTFSLEKPVDVEVTVKICVIQAYERVCLAEQRPVIPR